MYQLRRLDRELTALSPGSDVDELRADIWYRIGSVDCDGGHFESGPRALSRALDLSEDPALRKRARRALDLCEAGRLAAVSEDDAGSEAAADNTGGDAGATGQEEEEDRKAAERQVAEGREAAEREAAVERAAESRRMAAVASAEAQARREAEDQEESAQEDETQRTKERAKERQQRTRKKSRRSAVARSNGMLAGVVVGAVGAAAVYGTWSIYESDTSISSGEWTALQVGNTVGWAAVGAGSLIVVVNYDW
ncbi:hypothetical protein LBMAG42_54130 [Deltaproteobacteria bacterium]|nr:hypothetical protein LBMAG42_54130 [Deltaproteobacteria bacterium]